MALSTYTDFLTIFYDYIHRMSTTYYPIRQVIIGVFEPILPTFTPYVSVNILPVVRCILQTHNLSLTYNLANPLRSAFPNWRRVFLRDFIGKIWELSCFKWKYDIIDILKLISKSERESMLKSKKLKLKSIFILIVLFCLLTNSLPVSKLQSSLDTIQ